MAIPEEVALVGTGDLTFARLAAPPLTMIEIDGEALGRRAVELALARIQETDEGSEPAPFKEELLSTRIALRASSAPAALGHSQPTFGTAPKKRRRESFQQEQ